MADDDIVARLRGHIAITTRVHYAKDGYPEPVYVHGPSPICQEAADHIEHLRSAVEGWLKYSQRAERDIETLRAERDEARRKVCRFECKADTDWIDSPFPMQQSTPRIFAMLHGWDCFKEASDER